MIVQIYEIQNSSEAQELEKLGVDHIGIVVGKGKHPFELTFDQAKNIFKEIKKAKKVALSLSENINDLFEIIQEIKPDILHIACFQGKFSIENIKTIKRKFPQVKIMLSVAIIDEKSLDFAKEYDGVADYFLLDTHIKGKEFMGVTGKIHDWNISKKIVESVKTHVILAGDLGPDNIMEAIKKLNHLVLILKKTDTQDKKGKDLKKVEQFVKLAKSVKF